MIKIEYAKTCVRVVTLIDRDDPDSFRCLRIEHGLGECPDYYLIEFITNSWLES